MLLVDADVAKRHATRAFGAEERPGLTELLGDSARNPEDLVLGTTIPDLTFLPAGRRQELAPELFASQRMADVIHALGAADRRASCCSTAHRCLRRTNRRCWRRSVDQVVLVVRAESTTQPMVLEAVSLLDRSKEIRCILNQAQAANSRVLLRVREDTIHMNHKKSWSSALHAAAAGLRVLRCVVAPVCAPAAAAKRSSNRFSASTALARQPELVPRRCRRNRRSISGR